MALLSKRNLRHLKLFLLSPIVEQILIISYIVTILMLLYYNNDTNEGLSRGSTIQELQEYFKMEKFTNISAIDLSSTTPTAVNHIEYDLYDYLEFILGERLLSVEKTSNRITGVVRVAQARVETPECDSFTPIMPCDLLCYDTLHSELCSPLFSTKKADLDFTKATTCAYDDCNEYIIHSQKEEDDEQIPNYNGEYGTYNGDFLYEADFYYGDDYSTILSTLKSNSWIDENTKAVLVRFTIYNFWDKRYYHVEATSEIPTAGFFYNSFYINYVSLEDAENGLVLACIVILILN